MLLPQSKSFDVLLKRLSVILSTTLLTFDRALTLFNDKRNFDDSSDRFEEHFGSVNKVPPKQRRNLTLAKFAQFHQRNKMIESKPPINIPRFDVSLVVMPYVDGYSSTQQLRLEIHSGRKNATFICPIT